MLVHQGELLYAVCVCVSLSLNVREEKRREGLTVKSELFLHQTRTMCYTLKEKKSHS